MVVSAKARIQRDVSTLLKEWIYYPADKHIRKNSNRLTVLELRLDPHDRYSAYFVEYGDRDTNVSNVIAYKNRMSLVDAEQYIESKKARLEELGSPAGPVIDYEKQISEKAKVDAGKASACLQHIFELSKSMLASW